MSARELEAFLTRIYVDASARAAFKENPRGEARCAGLSEEECAALERTDWVGLELAAHSYASKRKSRVKQKELRSIRTRMLNFLAGLRKRMQFLL